MELKTTLLLKEMNLTYKEAVDVKLDRNDSDAEQFNFLWW